MISISRSDSNNPHFVQLVGMLDDHLADRDGEEHSFYAQFNKIDNLEQVIVAFDDSLPIGCGAIKKHNDNTVEVKRMFTLPDYRGKGVALMILEELESWAKELLFERSLLETGLRQPDAIKFYTKNKYVEIPNYGQYANVENSRCFAKTL
ncbi:MAG: putative acetyltransferase [Patiriisocius sp.]|jgi:putative acetyltransferase